MDEQNLNVKIIPPKEYLPKIAMAVAAVAMLIRCLSHQKSLKADMVTFSNWAGIGFCVGTAQSGRI